jgi:putative endonuclease
MQYVYVLISLKDYRLYIGTTSDLKKRLENHNSGYVKSTKSRMPFKLIYYEAYSDLSDAKRREKYLKGGKGHNELKIQIQDALIKNDYKFID